MSTAPDPDRDALILQYYPMVRRVAYKMAREIHPEVILVGHGAAMETPDDAQYMLDHTSGHGVWTGSSTERLPIERAVLEAATEFASLSFTEES